MTQYTHESVRWCLAQARTHHAKHEFTKAGRFNAVADEITELRRCAKALLNRVETDVDAKSWFIEEQSQLRQVLKLEGAQVE